MKYPDMEGVFSEPDRVTFKTYSHLANEKRIPNEYELVSSKMLYYFIRENFEVITPIAGWYDQYQKNSKIHSTIWHQFTDPMQTTYAEYVKRQRDKEISLDANFRQIEETNYDEHLPRQWVETMVQILPTLRYPWHGLQMISSYIGSMAPEGKVVIVLAFQTMDEMRRIQRIAYRMRQLQLSYPSFGVKSKEHWQTMPLWQPLRKAIELLLVTYDWLESFVALNFCFKPILDRLFLMHFANLAKKNGDVQIEVMFYSFWEDACWHQTWSLGLLELILQEDSSNKTIVQNWLNKWFDLLMPTVFEFQPIFGDDFDDVYAHLLSEYKLLLKNLNLKVKVK